MPLITLRVCLMPIKTIKLNKTSVSDFVLNLIP